MERNEYSPIKNGVRNKVDAFRAGQKMLVHATQAIRNGRPERELDPNFDPQEVPLQAVELMHTVTRQAEQELHDDSVLYEMESKMGDE
jgi:hypothetical protein